MNAIGGFTLLELLVVLAIIGLMLAVVPGFVLRGQPEMEFDVAARAIADGLRRARSEAMLHNGQQVFGLDVEARRFRVGEHEPPVQLNQTIELSFRTAHSELLSGTAAQIRFFPDGSSTGGRVSLALAGRRTEVTVDWLTGLVSLSDAAE